MIKFLHYPLLLFVLIFTASLSVVYAVTPYPPELSPQEDEGTSMMPGETVCLFESGTSDIKQVIRDADSLIVYRENPDHTLMEVGKLKVLSYSGKNFIRAMVVEGKLKANDIAQKGDVATLVISSKIECQ